MTAVRIATTEKLCMKCGLFRPLDDFPFRLRNADLAGSTCRDCEREIENKRRRRILAENEMLRMRQEMDRPKRFIDRKSRAAGERE